MYVIVTWLIFMVNVGKYTIHRWYGNEYHHTTRKKITPQKNHPRDVEKNLRKTSSDFLCPPDGSANSTGGTRTPVLVGSDIQRENRLSHEKNPYYFPLNPGWLIEILIMVYYNPYITG